MSKPFEDTIAEERLHLMDEPGCMVAPAMRKRSDREPLHAVD